MSVNHQYIDYTDQVVKRFRKTVPYVITGTRIDPKTGAKTDFLLKTPETDYDFDKKEQSGFSYDDEVIELYSENEVKQFMRFNRALFEDGILAEFSGIAPEIKKSNVLTDEEIEDIAGTTPLKAMQERLQTITSIPTLKRVLTMATEMERKVTYIRAVEARINELSTKAAEQHPLST